MNRQEESPRLEVVASTSAMSGKTDSGQQKPKEKASTSAESQLSSQMDDGSSSNNDVVVQVYGDMHRMILQGVMQAGFLDAKGVKTLFQETCKFLGCKVDPAEHMSPPFIQKVVREINEQIKEFGMIIRSATCEITGEKFYVFLITMEKQVMKLQTLFAKPELDLFQKILDSLLLNHTTGNFVISKADCINIVEDLNYRSFTKVHAEDFVDRMINWNYLTKVYNDKEKQEYDITLGFRTLREFEPVFHDMYRGIFADCYLCKVILLNGLQCPKCPAVVHRACAKRYIRSSKICPCCETQWKNENSLRVRTRESADYDDPSLIQAGYMEEPMQPGPSSYILDVSNDDVDMPVLEAVTSIPIKSSQGSKKNKKSSGTSKGAGVKDSNNASVSNIAVKGKKVTMTTTSMQKDAYTSTTASDFVGTSKSTAGTNAGSVGNTGICDKTGKIDNASIPTAIVPEPVAGSSKEKQVVKASSSSRRKSKPTKLTKVIVVSDSE